MQRRQIPIQWLVRAAMVLLIAQIPLLLVFWRRVYVAVEGDTTIYTGTMMLGVSMSFLSFFAVGVGALYWMTRQRHFQILGVIVAAIGVYGLFNLPSLFVHRLIVTPEYFEERAGAWYSPNIMKVGFGSLTYVVVTEGPADSHGRPTFELRCTSQGGETAALPVSDLIRKALPQILRLAAEHGAIVGEGADGQQIPSELQG